MTVPFRLSGRRDHDSATEAFDARTLSVDLR